MRERQSYQERDRTARVMGLCGFLRIVFFWRRCVCMHAYAYAGRAWPSLPPCGGRLTDGRTEADLLKGIYGRGGGGRARPVCHLHTQGGMAASGACRLVKRIAGHRTGPHAMQMQMQCNHAHARTVKKNCSRPRGPSSWPVSSVLFLLTHGRTDRRTESAAHATNLMKHFCYSGSDRQAFFMATRSI